MSNMKICILYLVVAITLINGILAETLLEAILLNRDRNCANKVRSCGSLILNLNRQNSREECERNAFRVATLCIENTNLECEIEVVELERIKESLVELARLIVVHCSVDRSLRLEAVLAHEVRKEINCIEEIRKCGRREISLVSPRILEENCRREALIAGARCVRKSTYDCDIEVPNLRKVEEIFMEIVRLVNANCAIESLNLVNLEDDTILKELLGVPITSEVLGDHILPVVPLLPEVLEHKTCSDGIRECGSVVLKLNPTEHCEQKSLVEISRCVNIVQENCDFVVGDLKNIEESVKELGRVITAHCQPMERKRLEATITEVHYNRSCLNKIRKCSQNIPMEQNFEDLSINCARVVLRESAHCVIKEAEDCDLYVHNLRAVEEIFREMVQLMTDKCPDKEVELVENTLLKPVVLIEG